MKNAKQIIWVIAKWSSIAAVAYFFYNNWNEQDKVSQRILILGVFMTYLAYIIVKRIYGINIFSSTETTTKGIKLSYVCVFRKEIYSDDDRLPVVTLRQKPKNIILSFPPYVGLYVSEGIWKEEEEEYINFYSGKIEKVEWNNSGNIFTCTVTQHKMMPQDILGEVIDHCEQNGWIIDGHDPKAKKALEDWRTQRAAG